MYSCSARCYLGRGCEYVVHYGNVTLDGWYDYLNVWLHKKIKMTILPPFEKEVGTCTPATLNSECYSIFECHILGVFSINSDSNIN